MSNKIKKRNPNFSTNEKSLLLYLVYAEKEIIENTKKTAATRKDKESAWRRIEDNFNNQSGSSCYRSSESLKSFYGNYIKEIRSENRQTGGGKPFKQKDPSSAIAVVNPKTIDGLENEVDGDNNEANDPNENTEDNEGNHHELNTPGISKKRPTASSLSSSKQCSELSRAKTELAKLYYETRKEKRYQRNIENELKKKSMELDVEIKTEILKKIKDKIAIPKIP